MKRRMEGVGHAGFEARSAKTLSLAKKGRLQGLKGEISPKFTRFREVLGQCLAEHKLQPRVRFQV